MRREIATTNIKMSSSSRSLLAFSNSQSGYCKNPLKTKRKNHKYLTSLVAISSISIAVLMYFHLSILECSQENELKNIISISNAGHEIKSQAVLDTIKEIRDGSNRIKQSPPIEEKFIKLADSWKKRSTELAKSLMKQTKPSETRPFIFFHQRKAGGSTFRQFLYDAANSHDVRSWIPSCRFGKVKCYVFGIPMHEKFAIYGGHFRFTEAHKSFIIPDFEQYLKHDKKRNQKPISCLVTARPTLDRVVSCWNYQFIQQMNLKVPLSSDMTVQQWDELLPMAFSKYKNGCNNEFIRNFGTIQDEIVINSMKPSGNENSDMQALHELDNIFDRISNCVVTTLPKCDEGLEVIDHFLPWIQQHSKYNCGAKVNKGEFSKPNKLDHDAENVILKHNFLDELIYDFIDTLFEEQLKLARAN